MDVPKGKNRPSTQYEGGGGLEHQQTSPTRKLSTLSPYMYIMYIYIYIIPFGCGFNRWGGITIQRSPLKLCRPRVTLDLCMLGFRLGVWGVGCLNIDPKNAMMLVMSIQLPKKGPLILGSHCISIYPNLGYITQNLKWLKP